MKFAFKTGEGYMLWSYEFCYQDESSADIKFFELNENASIFKPTLKRQTIGKVILKNGEEIRLVKNDTVIAHVCHTIIRNMKDALGENENFFKWSFFNRRTDTLSNEQIDKIILIDGIEAKLD